MQRDERHRQREGTQSRTSQRHSRWRDGETEHAHRATDSDREREGDIETEAETESARASGRSAYVGRPPNLVTPPVRSPKRAIPPPTTAAIPLQPRLRPIRVRSKSVIRPLRPDDLNRRARQDPVGLPPVSRGPSRRFGVICSHRPRSAAAASPVCPHTKSRLQIQNAHTIWRRRKISKNMDEIIDYWI